MAQIRRKFVYVHEAQGSAITEEAIRRFAKLYSVEKAARGLPPDKRTKIKLAEAKSLFNSLEPRLSGQLSERSGKFVLASASWNWTRTSPKGRCGPSRLGRKNHFVVGP